jgi:hypothetical protein
MENYYENSVTVRAIESAHDIWVTGRCNQNSTFYQPQQQSRKRSRSRQDSEEKLNLFIEIIKQIEYSDLYPTFRTLCLKRFYLLLAYNTDHEMYTEVASVVMSFKQILSQCDKLVYDGELDQVYYLLTDELTKLLYGSQQLILLFHLSAKSPEGRD